MSSTPQGKTALIAFAIFALLGIGSAPLVAQNTGTIRGEVVAQQTQRPLAGAQVSIPGTRLGTLTNAQGQYLIVGVAPGNKTVRVQMIGFGVAENPVDVVAGETATQNFQLSQTAIALDEVVVTGTAAAVRKKEIGNSLEAITSAQIENQPIQSAQQVLQGRTPGVTVMTGGGQAGAGGTIKIRGINSVSQDTEPLIYVDGVRIFNLPTRSGWGSRTGISPLQNIPAEDIARMEVVKGAAATTLYGTEASGGVIQIFTKRGTAGAPVWSAEVTQGILRQGDITPFDDPDQLFTQCGGVSRGIITSGTRKGEFQEFMDPTCPADGDWWETGYEQGYNLSVRGGSEDVTYFMSGNYTNVDGVLPTQGNREGGFRGNFGFSPIEQINVQLNTAYNRRNTRWVEDGNNNDGFLLNVGRGFRNYYKGGREDDCAAVPAEMVCVSNGYLFQDADLLSRSDNFILGSTLQWNPTTNLSNRFTVGYDYTDMNNEYTHHFGHFDEPEGYFWDENTRHTKLSLDYAGTFQNKFGQSLSSSFSWGGQIFRDFHRWTQVNVENFAGPGEPTLETGAIVAFRAEDRIAETSAGFFLQEQLGFQDRLFVTGGLRVDGHSAFGDEFGLQTYPKLSASWVLSDYDFFPTGWWDTFKLRAAVGASGKAPDAFAQFRTFAPVSADEGEPGFTPQEVGNADIGPERTLEFEGGFDASWFSGRLGLEFTAYRATTTDALVPITLPPSEGFLNRRLSNVGELRSSGLEFAVNLGLVRAQNVDWRIRTTASFEDSEAVDLEGQEIFADNKAEFREGFRAPTYFGTKIINGHLNTDPVVLVEPGEQCRADQACIVEDQDLGPVFPTTLLGFGTDVRLFNRLSLDALAEYQGGHFLPNYTGYQNARRGVWFPCYDIQQMQVRAEQAGNTSELDAAGITALQRAQCSLSGFNSDFWVEPADFLKLRYVSLTYDVPQRFVRFSNSASVTLSARNLFTWTDYSGTDPEVEDFADRSSLVFDGAGDVGRRDYYTIPSPRSFLLSFRVSF
jgi:TonB-linked SusC/RagA family outer membrane protein